MAYSFIPPLPINKRQNRQLGKIDLDLKPCPLCGKSVLAFAEQSPDGTINWIRIIHSAETPCGISFFEDEREAEDKWNARTNNDAESNLEKLLFDLKQWAATQKKDHELPNNNDGDYNRGYVKAMNDLINRLK